MNELVALKVKLTRERAMHRGKEQLRNRYPAFNTLPPEVRTPPGFDHPLDWSFYVGEVGCGWFYDSASGFGFADDENPDPRVIYGVICVPIEFATAAEQAFPDLCTIMEPDDFVAWRARRVTHDAPDVKFDADALTGAHAALELAKALGDPATLAEVTAEARRVLDAGETQVRGRRANTDKDWESFARRRGIQLRGRHA